uniref:ABC transporter ATP-binding protein n=1 Tax=candidate division WOR-3 bacterium TaxID=2052148 RepID=A0A7V3NU39_UNCW3
MQRDDLKLFVKYFKKYTLSQGSLFALSLLLLLIGTLLQLPVPLIFKEIIDRVIPSRNLGLVGLYSILIAVVVILREITLYFSKVIDQKLKNGIYKRLVSELLNVYYSLPYKTIKSKDSGYFYSRVFNEPAELEESLTTTMTFAIKIFLIFAFGLIVCLKLSWKLTLFVLVLSSVFYLLNVIFGNAIRGYSVKFQEYKARFGETAVELLKGFKLINFMGLLEKVKGLLEPKMKDYLGLRLERTEVSGMYSGFYGILSDFLPVGVFLLGAIEIVRGHLTVGGLVAFMELMRYVSSPIDSLSEIFIEIQTTVGIIERVEEFKGMEGKRGGKGLQGELETISLEAIAVKFEDEEVISNFAFEFKKGKKYAIIGPNGSGKSTLLEVITGILEPDEGDIKINGKYDLKELDKFEYFQRFAVSFYPPMLLPSLKDNLDLIARDGLVEIAKNEVLKGRDDLKFSQLSAGEKQKLSLLIALSRGKRDFILLDEPLANLDDDSKEFYWRLIREYSEGKGLIVALPSQEVDLSGFEVIKLEKPSYINQT